MPRFHFHIENDIGYVRDEEGQDLPGEAAALQVAGRTLGDILSDELATAGAPFSVTVFVEDASGETIFKVPVKAAVERLKGS